MRALLPLLSLLAACAGEAPTPEVLRLVDLLPPAGETLLLNDELALIFDAPVEPSSVTRHALLLTGADGREVAGEWRVDGRKLEFSPAPVLARDLSDGGFRPGETLELVVRGFPSPSALRSHAGHWLGATLRIPYRVIDVGGEQKGFVFDDATPNRAAPLEVLPNDPGMPLGRPLEPGERLVLRCKEPIDPSSLVEADLRVLHEDSRTTSGVRLLELLENFDDEQVSDVGASRARLAVYFDRTLGEGLYRLYFSGRLGSSLLDFRGSSVAQTQLRQGLVFRVGHEGERNDFNLDFEDDTLALPLAVEGADSTARWEDDGRVTVRYPRSAGSGADGAVVLDRGPLPALDVHATRLSLARGVEHELPARGLVVLRAQGRIELAGRLVRRSGSAPSRMLEPRLRAAQPYPTLTSFLAAAAETQPDWTVIIAGGDLVVSGVIDVDTPLLLVAGGRIRGAAPPRLSGAAQYQSWQLGDGGFDLAVDAPESQRSLAAALRMDPPLENELREPLVAAVVSLPLDLAIAPERWREHETIGRGEAGGRGPHGDWAVRFAPRDLAEPSLVARGMLAATPWELGQPTFRVVLELTVHPARRRPDGSLEPDQPWDPPFIDRVRLAWAPR